MRRKETNSSPVSLLIAGLPLVVSVKAFGEPAATSQQAIAQSRRSGQIVGRVRVEGRLKKPPAGVYKIEFWHEKLDRLLRKVEVMEDQISRVDLVFPCVAC